jgi:hypothetical protein
MPMGGLRRTSVVGDPSRSSRRKAAMNNQPQTSWEIVRQAHALHPDWTVTEHVANLRDEEGREIDPIWVARWLRNIAAETSH